MKALRILYMVVVYIAAIPVLAVLSMWFFPWLCIKNMRIDGKLHFKEMYDAAMEGLRIGHKCNMIWVKYGNNYNTDDILREFGAID